MKYSDRPDRPRRRNDDSTRSGRRRRVRGHGTEEAAPQQASAYVSDEESTRVYRPRSFGPHSLEAISYAVSSGLRKRASAWHALARHGKQVGALCAVAAIATVFALGSLDESGERTVSLRATSAASRPKPGAPAIADRIAPPRAASSEAPAQAPTLAPSATPQAPARVTPADRASEAPRAGVRAAVGRTPPRSSRPHDRQRRSRRTAASREARAHRPAKQPQESAPSPDTVRAPANATGVVRINTRPWSKVYVDGQFVGNTPQRSLVLTAGPHTLTLINTDFGLRRILTVRVRSGETLTRTLDLQ